MSFEKGKMTRRGMLMGAAALAAYEATQIPNTEKEGKTADTQTEPVPNPQNTERGRLDFLDVQKQPQEYRMAELSGHKFGDLLTKYTGVDGKVPDVAQIDFRYQLASMWKEKLSLMEKSAPLAPGVVDAVEDIFEPYDVKRSTKMDIREYISKISGALRDVRIADLGRVRDLPAFSEFTDSQVALLRHLEASIDVQALLSYALTELLPTQRRDAPLGVAIFEFLLSNAGREYIDSIPALHDRFLSSGPYQFTGLALKHQGQHREGASVMDLLSKDPQMPDGVSALRGNDHHKAAYLFALFNLAHLVKRLGESKSRTPERLEAHFAEMPADTVLEYIAAAHHAPEHAITAFKAFAEAFIAQKEAPHKGRAHESATLDFLDYCGKDVEEYARKTKGNLYAVQSYLARKQAKN